MDKAVEKSIIDHFNEVITDIMTPVRARQTREVNVANAAAGCRRDCNETCCIIGGDSLI
jgi:hypothetical protein